jgi:hypothetical protein
MPGFPKNITLPKSIDEVIASRKQSAGQRQVQQAVNQQYFPEETGQPKTAPEKTTTEKIFERGKVGAF